MALLVGIDRFMAQCRGVTNFIGNAVATIAIARWNGALDLSRAQSVLDGESGSAAIDGRDAPHAVNAHTGSVTVAASR